MPNKKSTPRIPTFDTQAAAFIREIQGSPMPFDKEQINSVGFQDLPAAELKKCLDHLIDLYGNLDHWSYQDIMTARISLYNNARAAMNVRHEHDLDNLRKAYGNAPVNWGTIQCHTAAENEIVAGLTEELTDKSVVQILECQAFKLKLHCKEEAGQARAFCIADATKEIFSPIGEAFVYLFFPFNNLANVEVDAYAGAPMYWTKNGKIIAAGHIGDMHISDLVVTDSGLIIPAVAVRDQRAFRTFKISEAAPETYKRATQHLNRHAKYMKENNAEWASRDEYLGGGRPLPNVPTQIDAHIANELEQHLNLLYESSKELAEFAIAAQRRDNLQISHTG